MIVSMLMFNIITFTFLTVSYDAIPVWLRIILFALISISNLIAYASEKYFAQQNRAFGKQNEELKERRYGIMDLFAKGWECPKCGAVMSPTTKVCVNCRGKTQSVSNILNISNNSIDRPYRPCEEQNSIDRPHDPTAIQLKGE